MIKLVIDKESLRLNADLENIKMDDLNQQAFELARRADVVIVEGKGIPVPILLKDKWGDIIPRLEPKLFRVTWRHSVYIKANNIEEARKIWEGLDLGKLDEYLRSEEESDRSGDSIDHHEYIELTSFEEEV